MSAKLYPPSKKSDFSSKLLEWTCLSHISTSSCSPCVWRFVDLLMGKSVQNSPPSDVGKAKPMRGRPRKVSRPGKPLVAPNPVATAGRFSFQLAKAHQCISSNLYEFTPNSEELIYFTTLVLDVLKQLPVAGAPLHGLVSAVSNAMSDEHAETIELKSILFGQLKHEPNPQDVIVSRKPLPNANPDYMPDVFENYQAIHKDGKQRDMVHAPVPCSLS